MKSIFLDFIPVFCRTLISLWVFTYFRLTVLQINTFWFAPSGFLHAVYSDYTPCKAKESQVLLWFFPGAEISGIHNHFSKLRMPLPPVWNGSSGTGSRFRSGYFRMIPDASPESFLKYTAVYSLSHGYIFTYGDNRCNHRIHTRLLPIHSHFCFSASLRKELSTFYRHGRYMCPSPYHTPYFHVY